MSECSELTKIEKKAFDGCESLKNVRFPKNDTLKEIGEKAFWNCKSIEALVIPSSVKSIGDYAFHGCSNLKVVKLPDAIDLEKVPHNIFHGCTALEAVFPTDKIKPKERLQWLKERYDAFPLHKLCYNVLATKGQIEQCIDQHPTSTSVIDEVGMSAINLMSMLAGASNDHNTASEMIQCMYEKNNDVAFIQDKYGRLPLHYLAEIASEDLIASMATLGKSMDDSGLCAASVVDKDGRTALHYLTMNRIATALMIKELINVYPETATLQDKYREIPLHYGLDNKQLVKREGCDSIVDLLAYDGCDHNER